MACLSQMVWSLGYKLRESSSDATTYPYSFQDALELKANFSLDTIESNHWKET